MKRRKSIKGTMQDSHCLVNLPCHVARLHQLPDPLPPDALMLYMGRGLNGRAVLLCPVDKLNSVPKGFRHRVQAVMPFWKPNGERLVIIHRNGRVYLVDDNQSPGY